MVSLQKVFMLLCLPLLLCPLHCIAAHNLESSCALESTSTEPLITSEVCLGKSLLQAYAHTSTWRTAGIQNSTNAKVLGPGGPPYQEPELPPPYKGFRHKLGEFCIGVFCVVLFACGYLYCCIPTKKHSGAPGVAWRATETGQGSIPAGSPSETDAGARSAALQKLAHKEEESAALQSLAFKEESDAGDWVVDAGCEMDHQLSHYDPDCIPKYIEEHFSSWQLLIKVLGSLAQFWGALAYLYWALLFRKEELMNCEAYPPRASHPVFVVHACHYTLACLQGFPVLAANMILVLMIRTLLQTRFYYSMLRSGFIVVFQALPIMYTMWPYIIGFSMLQGGLHFVLKAWFEPEDVVFEAWARLLRKFILPGSIFFSMLFRYADVENLLVPLNHIAELEVTQKQNYCPWLANCKVVNERVIAFEARHRDVYSDTMSEIGRAPCLDDIMQNVIKSYESASRVWSTRNHRSWGLFRSMWPAELLLNRQLDWNDKDTRSWLQVSFLLAGASATLSLLSAYGLLAAITSDTWNMFGASIKNLETRHVSNTATNLGLAVTVFHVVFVILLMVNTVRGMFYFSLSQNEIHETMRKGVDKAMDKAVESLSLKGATQEAVLPRID